MKEISAGCTSQTVERLSRRRAVGQQRRRPGESRRLRSKGPALRTLRRELSPAQVSFEPPNRAQRGASGAEFPPFQPAGLRAGGATAVVGLFEFTLRLRHDFARFR